MEYLLLETDCPYLAPVPNRGKRNDSGMLKYVVQELAVLKGITPEEVIRAMKRNHIYEEAIPDMYRAQLTLEDQGISFEKPFLNIRDAEQSVMDSFEKGEGKHA